MRLVTLAFLSIHLIGIDATGLLASRLRISTLGSRRICRFSCAYSDYPDRLIASLLSSGRAFYYFTFSLPATAASLDTLQTRSVQ